MRRWRVLSRPHRRTRSPDRRPSPWRYSASLTRMFFAADCKVEVVADPLDHETRAVTWAVVRFAARASNRPMRSGYLIPRAVVELAVDTTILPRCSTPLTSRSLGNGTSLLCELLCLAAQAVEIVVDQLNSPSINGVTWTPRPSPRQTAPARGPLCRRLSPFHASARSQ